VVGRYECRVALKMEAYIHQITWCHNPNPKNKQIKINKSAQNSFIPEHLAAVNVLFIFKVVIFKQYIPEKYKLTTIYKLCDRAGYT
jgi:hypothetical protein